MAEFSSLRLVDLADYRTLSPRPVYGTLGLITVENDVFICIVTGASKVANVRPNETVDKIYAVQFYCLSSSKYDDVVNDGTNPNGFDQNGEDEYSYGHNLSQRDSPIEHPCVDLTKMLSNGSFYYSTDFDLTNRLQDRYVGDATPFLILPKLISVLGLPSLPYLTSTISTNHSYGIHT